MRTIVNTIDDQSCLVVTAGTPCPADRELLGEEPLLIRVGSAPAATLMRTPGFEIELALGHLLTEGIVPSLDAFGTIAFCPDAKDGANVVHVSCVDGAAIKLPVHRQVFSSCAVCGTEQIEAIARDLPAFGPRPGRLTYAGVTALARRMGRHQELFLRTGASHGAALALHPLGEAQLERIIVREDIGRHNALDKAVGAAVSSGLDLRRAALCLSSRLSFEMVAKAARVGISDVIGLSAPTAMAVRVARRLGMFLAGFVRGENFTVYSGSEALQP